MTTFFTHLKTALEHHLSDPGRRDRWILFFTLVLRSGFFFYVLFSSLGMAPRQIGCITALAGLLGYYALNYENSNLKRLGWLKWIYVLFLTYLFFKVFHNINVGNGWYGFSTNAHEGFALFFAGLECVRSRRDLSILVVLCALAGFGQGLNGVYQWFTGADFVRGTEIIYWHGGARLTGSMKTYRVGNYLSMIIPISIGLWWLLPRHWPHIARGIIMTLILAPQCFLLVGSQTRSAFLGTFVSLVALIILHRGFSWKYTAGTLGVAVWALFFGFERTSWDMIMQDGRVAELWPFALEVFKTAPWFGVGLNSFNPGVHEIGLEFTMHTQTLQHPHNIYLQFLCEMGIVGLLILLVFLGVYLVWSLGHIRAGLSRDTESKATWAVASCFWVSFLGYTATALSAHDFFRTWWLALALSTLGILLGSCLSMQRPELADGRP